MGGLRCPSSANRGHSANRSTYDLDEMFQVGVLLEFTYFGIF